MAIPGFCGPLVYSIVEPYSSFLTADPNTGMITCFSNNMLEVGVYPATLQVALANYPSITPATLTFTASLVDPCVAYTVLTLPTTLSTFTITVLDGIGFSQTFMPATDSAATNSLIPNLCGPRVYTIVEPQPASFITIIPPPAG